MNEKMFFHLAGIAILTLIILSSPVYAQYQSSDYVQSIVTTLLGTLPSSCVQAFGSPVCISCLGTLKLMPLIFFTTIFYFVLYIVILNTFSRPDTNNPLKTIVEASNRNITKSERKIAITIAILLALVFLHSTQLERGILQMGLWIQIFFLVFAILFVRSILQATGLPAIIAMILVFVLFWWLWASMGEPVVAGWIAGCI